MDDKIVKDCVITGVEFNVDVMKAITAIANGLTANAEAFKALADVLKADNINIDALVKFGEEEKDKIK